MYEPISCRYRRRMLWATSLKHVLDVRRHAASDFQSLTSMADAIALRGMLGESYQDV